MEGIVNIFVFCILFGTITLCICLIIYAVLRWLKPGEAKDYKFYILAFISFIVLCVLALIRLVTSIFMGDINDDDIKGLRFLLFKLSTAVVQGLLFGIIVAFVIILLLIIILCLGKVVWRLLSSFKSTESGGNTKLSGVSRNNSAFFAVVKSSEVALIITGGIISLFFVIPFLACEQEKGNFLEIWKDGVINIATCFASDNMQGRIEFVQAISLYALDYIILLGVGLAVVKILHSLIADSLHKKKTVNLIDTYSNSIALLAVGVSLLLLFRGEEDPFNMGRRKLLLELGKYVLTVVIAATLLILALEVIRLLLDMRQKLIRQEAKYIFISLIGKSSLFMLEMMDSIFDALNNAVGGDRDSRLLKIDKKLKKKIVHAMEKAIDQEEEFPIQCSEEDKDGYETVFNSFDEHVTKK